ncbi:hypothetical protein KFL_003580120 [Klebsormidium nitens]|uniref:Uncharacterized protein n=1 Tax=Klebsormidium nitens TaxID=105231 RepID=A0A1Y1IDK3_KLENI|nr:hypothetical protein KFL_003580120 [Klebsormidium nitens]|eukprot:GAQ87519.1 hypothetical protein KFL_003580120 [Klebsormidium nitens]
MAALALRSAAAPACAALTFSSPASPAGQSNLRSGGCSFLASCSQLVTQAPSSVAPPQRHASVRAADPDLEDFEKRLESLRRVPRGEGAKAQKRKGAGAEEPRKGDDKKEVYLEPVSLQEPAVNGVPLSLGFAPYAEILNGQLALLGLGALLSVELYTGGALVNFHEGGTIGTQAYFILGLSAMLIKFQKEKISVWPEGKK